MLPTFHAPPPEYYTNFDAAPAAAAATTETPHATPHLNCEAADRSPSQAQQQPTKGQNPCVLLPPTIAAAAAAANPANAAARAQTTSSDSHTPEDVETVLNDTMELFISNASIERTYELRGELGRGKYGRVYLVEDCVQHRLLAVKTTYDPNWIASVRHMHGRSQQQQQQFSTPVMNVNSHATTATAAAVKLLPRTQLGANVSPLKPPSTHISNEVACMRECNSPFIVRLEAAEKGEHGEDLLLMEYVDCGDLRQEIRRRRAINHYFTETEVAFIFLQLCMAVDHLHQRNILHHDLKPENIVLSSTGVVKLGDFGFARKYAEPVCNRVASTGCGTPYYLSPEALRGERYSLKSEMWALGVILYELMALTGPFVAANRTDLRHKVYEGRYAPLPTMYSHALQDVCVQLLCQDPERRPSAHELFTENEYLRGLLNELRHTSECSTKMTAEEKKLVFYSISAALRRRSPAAPRGIAVGGGSTCNSWASSLDNSSGVSGGAATAATAQRARVEC